MADSVNLDWGLLNENNPNYNQNVNQTALSSLQLQQARGGYNALQGIDTSDPNAIQNAVGNSIKSGDLPQASALLGFGRQQMLYNLADQAIKAKSAQLQPNALQGVPQTPMMPQQNSDVQSTLGGAPTPQTEATNVAPETVNIGGQDYDKQKYLDHADKIDFEVDNAKSKTGDERSAYVQKIAPDLGFTPEQVANADLSDEGLDKIKNTLQAHRDVVSGNVQQVSPNDIIDPDFVQQMALTSGDPAKITEAFKATHPNMEETGLPGVFYNPNTKQTVRLVSGNDISTQAAQTAGATAAAQVGPHAAEEQNKVDIGNKNPTNVIRTRINGVDTDIPAPIYQHLVATNYPGLGVGLSPEEKARQDALGGVEGGLHEIKGKDANGNPIVTTTVGLNPIAQTPSDVDVDWNKQGQIALRAVMTSSANNMKNYQSDDFNNHKMLALANSIGNAGPYNQILGDMAQRGAPFLGNGDIKKFATDVPALGEALGHYTRSQFDGALPRIANEYTSIAGNLPKNTSPQDQIKIDSLLSIAKRNYDNEGDKFISSNGASLKNRSPEGARLSFDQTQGGRSILSYALPELQKTTINGQPAIGPTFQYKGHTWTNFTPLDQKLPNGKTKHFPIQVD